jgi:hypothetical protein
MAALMLGGCAVIAIAARDRVQQRLALWLGGLLVFLFAALGAAWLDRDTAHLGALYLFRPTSLTLLLWLAVALAFATRVAGRHAWWLRLCALAVLLPSFLSATYGRAQYELRQHAAYEEDKSGLVAFLARRTQPDDIVLIDPVIEIDFLDLERVARRPSLVTWKFMPTDPPSIREWYRRSEFRRALFDGACAAPERRYRVAYLLTTVERAQGELRACGAAAYEGGKIALLRVPASR